MIRWNKTITLIADLKFYAKIFVYLVKNEIGERLCKIFKDDYQSFLFSKRCDNTIESKQNRLTFSFKLVKTHTQNILNQTYF